MKVRVVIAGVNHNDPLGRDRILSLLKNLANEGFKPDCIATEWDEKIAELVIKQRDKFYEKMKDSYPSLSEETTSTLKYAIAYEVDSHVSLYPNLPMIWLEEGRKDKIIQDDDNINKFAEYRFNYYNDKLSKLIDVDSKNILEEISLISWCISNNNYTNKSDYNLERNKRFHRAIKNAISVKGYKNIFVIVGAKHADNKSEASLAALLAKDNIDLDIFILNGQI